MKVEATEVDGRKVYAVRAFSKGVASWLSRLPTVWVEGEVTELRRQARWTSVFFTLKDPDDGASLGVQMQRTRFDALDLDLANGERVHVFGRPELYEQRGELRLRALTIERFGLGAHLAALERLKRTLAAEGLFDATRKRSLPRFPRLIGLVTGNDAAAKRDILTHIGQRFPPRTSSSPKPTSRALAHPRRSSLQSESCADAVSTSSSWRAAAGASKTSCRSPTSE